MQLRKTHTPDERVVNAYFNRREGDDPNVPIEQLKQGRKGRDEILYTAGYRDFHFD